MDDIGRYTRDPLINGLCRAINMSGRYGCLIMEYEYPTVPGRQWWLVVLDEEKITFGIPEEARWICLSRQFEGQWKGLIGMLGLNAPDALDRFYERASAMIGGE